MARIQPFLERAKKNKKSSIFILAIFILITYWGYGKIFVSPAATQYVFASVAKNSLVTSVTGTGTVSASQELDIKAKSSGEAVFIGAKEGDPVGAGAVLTELDGKDAKIALDNAQIDLDKLKGDTTDSRTLDAAINDISSTILDLTDISDGLKNLFDFNAGYLGGYNTGNIGVTSDQYIHTAGSELFNAQANLDALKSVYDNFNRSSDASTIGSVLAQTYDVTKGFSQTLKDTKIAVDYVKDQKPSTSTVGSTAQTNVATWLGKANTNLSALLGDQSGIQSNNLDLRSATLNLEQKQSAYDDTFIRAPWSGVVAKMNVNQGDNVSSGEVVAQLISPAKIVNISLNEVDAATVAVGDKASLTFDAVDGLTLTGKVTSVDILGTVSQGVVTYNVKIALDSDDSRLKPGMSASAAIITTIKNDVLTVPAGAVKSSNNEYYVQELKNGVPTNVTVTIGNSNETDTEIVSGLSEGEQVITRIIQPNATKTQAPSAASLFGGSGARTGGGGGAAGGGTRALGR